MISNPLQNKSRLLIHGAPGSRLGFVSAFLLDQLQSNTYDVGDQIASVKYHHFNNEILKFPGKKIYIQLSIKDLWLHLYLFFDKNVRRLEPGFDALHYTHRDIFDKLYCACRQWFLEESQTPLDIYDYTISFVNTYSLEHLIELYQKFNGRDPSPLLLSAVTSTNAINRPEVPVNHGARVAAAVWTFENQNQFKESQRRWSINNDAPFDHLTGVCLDPANYFDNIMAKLNPMYYIQEVQYDN